MRQGIALVLWSGALLAGLPLSPLSADDTAVAPIEHVSCRGAPHEIRIVIRNVKNSVGLMTADLYRNDEEGFLKREGRVEQVRFAAKSPVTAFCIAAPTAAPYAIAVYHDQNANKTFDKNALGLPVEPFGVSNNPSMRFAPPKVAEALFDVPPEGVTVEIELKN